MKCGPLWILPQVGGEKVHRSLSAGIAAKEGKEVEGVETGARTGAR